MAKRQIEIPVHNNKNVTSRSLKEDHPNNQNLYQSSKEFQDLLKEVKIRFDTNPKFYQREDFQKLIELIKKKSGSSDLTVEIVGSGNVVTDVSYDNGILTITKEEISGGSKEYFPDYAFWQKPGAKKGAQVLWSNIKLNHFGYPDKALGGGSRLSDFDSWIQVGSMQRVSPEYVSPGQHALEQIDFNQSDIYSFSNFDIETLRKRLVYLLEIGALNNGDIIPIRFGLLNMIHLEDDLGVIRFKSDEYQFICSDFEGHLVFNMTVSEILTWLNISTAYLQCAPQDEEEGIWRTYDEFNKKLQTLEYLDIYIPMSVYFTDLMKTIRDEEEELVRTGWNLHRSLYILQYYKKQDAWTLKKIKQRKIRVKYHTTEYQWWLDKIIRSNYREYKFPQKVNKLPSSERKRLSLYKVYSASHARKSTKLRILNYFTYRKIRRRGSHEMRSTVLFGKKSSAGVYYMYSYGEVYKRCGHKPQNEKPWTVFDAGYGQCWRRANRVFYKTWIPIYRRYGERKIEFEEYIMPKIAY